ncbi:ATP-dependent zinc metalloprotease FtsH [Arthrobacter sp. Hiyo1]|nr:ATP-dependent zinc metalloprotease FtsH [Arthrobacter sp. Hiyo1]
MQHYQEGRGGAPEQMKAKSFFKGPGIWIVVVVGLLLVAFATLAPGGSTRIDTDKGLAILSQSGKVDQAKIYDAENRVDLTLKDNLVIDGQDKGKNVQSSTSPREPGMSSRPSPTPSHPVASRTSPSRTTGSPGCSPSSSPSSCWVCFSGSCSPACKAAVPR